MLYTYGVGILVEPISGSAIAEASRRVTESGIGRSTVEILPSAKGLLIYEDKFTIKLWEIAAAVGITAAVYYLPQIISAYNPAAAVTSLGEWWKDPQRQIGFGLLPPFEMITEAKPPEKKPIPPKLEPIFREALRSRTEPFLDPFRP